MPPKSQPRQAKNGAGSSTVLNRAPQILWHIIGLAIFQYAFYSLDAVANISGLDIESMFGGHYQFLTMVGLWITRLSVILALLHDLMPGMEPLGRAKTFAMIVALPMESIISMLYWTILTINPDLLVPPRKVASPDNPAQFIFETVRLPLSIDLSMHAAPAIILLVVSMEWGRGRLARDIHRRSVADCILRYSACQDYLFFSPPFPRSTRPVLLSAVTVAGYSVWCEICAAKNNHYPYPLLGILSTPVRIALYSGCAIVFVIVSMAAKTAHAGMDKALGRKWGPDSADVKKSANGKRATPAKSGHASSK